VSPAGTNPSAERLLLRSKRMVHGAHLPAPSPSSPWPAFDPTPGLPSTMALAYPQSCPWPTLNHATDETPKPGHSLGAPGGAQGGGWPLRAPQISSRIHNHATGLTTTTHSQNPQPGRQANPQSRPLTCRARRDSGLWLVRMTATASVRNWSKESCLVQEYFRSLAGAVCSNL